MSDEDRTHYVDDDCPGGHADVAVRLGLVRCSCGRHLPCRHCNQEDDRG